jgi:hypothetical protein
MKISKSRSVVLPINPQCFIVISTEYEHWKELDKHVGAI